jgi:hypothetical protein
MDLELPEFDTTTVALTLALWVFFSAFFWFIPELVGLKGYSMWMKISLTVALLPIAYLICNHMVNK